MAQLTAFDVVVLLMVGLAAAAGVARGFVTEVLSLLAWVAALLAVRFLYPVGRLLAVHLTGTIAGGSILAFVMIFVVTFVAFRRVAGMLGQRTRDSIVGPFDRVLGFGFGACKGLIGASVVYLVLSFGYDVVDAGGPRPEWLANGRTRPLLEVTSRTMVDLVEQRRHRDNPHRQPVGGQDGDPGYSPDDRNALDKLLDKGGGTPI